MANLSKMNSLINKLSDQPFKYGKCDCYTFTAALVKQWHGKDYTKNHAVYKNKKQADEYMDQYLGIEQLTRGTLGYSVAAEHCRSGDVASAEVAPGEVALGFVYQGKAMFKTKKGVIKVPLKKCRMGWRIR